MIGFRRRSRSLGERGEDLAVRALKKTGYAILERNIHLGRYEIDIIARKDDTVAFVEVKTRRSDEYASPDENVHTEKRRRIISAAKIYITRRNDPTVYYRFDIAAVLIPTKGKPTVTLYDNAFQVR